MISISATFLLNGSNSCNWFLKNLTSAASFLKLFNSVNCCLIALFSALKLLISLSELPLSIIDNWFLYVLIVLVKAFNLSWINWCSFFNELVVPSIWFNLGSGTFFSSFFKSYCVWLSVKVFLITSFFTSITFSVSFLTFGRGRVKTFVSAWGTDTTVAVGSDFFVVFVVFVVLVVW